VPFFLSFEGIDGCGKTTQLTLLHARLESAGHTVIATREPGGTALAEAIRDYLLHSTQPLDRTTELLLFGAARAQHVAEVISPALERGTIVLSDRFADSSLAYQGGGLGIGMDFIRRMNAFATNGVQPDVTILLDVHPLVGLQRRATQRGEDRIEERGLEFQQRVRDAFLDIARAEPERVIILDGSTPAKVVHNRIIRALQERSLMSTVTS
jgi:dTMP kinase